MNDADDENRYTIPIELAAAAREAERQITKASQAVESGFLVQKNIVVLRVSWSERSNDLEITTNDLLATLDVEKGRAFDSAEARHKPSSPPEYPKPDSERPIAINISRFVELFYDEIVSIICKGDKKNLGTTTHSALVALAAWLATHLSVNAVLATPVATAILIAITRATKGAFCKMAAEDAKRLIAARAK
jgi:hypothetical protein